MKFTLQLISILALLAFFPVNLFSGQPSHPIRQEQRIIEEIVRNINGILDDTVNEGCVDARVRINASEQPDIRCAVMQSKSEKNKYWYFCTVMFDVNPYVCEPPGKWLTTSCGLSYSIVGSDLSTLRTGPRDEIEYCLENINDP
ncbi:MAG: hypothetical protein AAB116_19850 [Candidatus Poribacteria bacterium]